MDRSDSRLLTKTTRGKKLLTGKNNRFIRSNGEGGFLPRTNFGLPVDCATFFFQLQSFARIFFIKSGFYDIRLRCCTWRVCSGPVCGDLPSLGEAVQRKRLQSVDVDALA